MALYHIAGTTDAHAMRELARKRGIDFHEHRLGESCNDGCQVGYRGRHSKPVAVAASR